MSLQVEKLERNMAKLTIEVAAEELDAAMQKVYLSAKGRINVPGFRKGKAPRKMIERMFGAGIFLEDAVNSLVPDKYNEAMEECDLDIVSRPRISVDQMEPGKPLVFTAEVAVKPEVTLGQYKGLEVPKQDVTVTEEEVDSAIRTEQEKNGRTITVEDRPAASGDTVVIDFAGTVNGEPFEGGSGEDHRLVLGSGTFIPGFEDQLVGTAAGDHKDVTVTFPENYHEKSMAGKEAVFACEVKSVETKELPELDDEFAQDVSEFETFAEYKNSVRENLEKNKADAARRTKMDAAVGKAAELAGIDVPEPMVETQALQMVEDYAQSIQGQGIGFDQYLSYMGQTRDQFVESTKPAALSRIRSTLTLEKVAETENIQISDEEVDAELSKIADSYKMELDKVKELYGEDALERLKKDLSLQKAAELIGDSAVEVEKTEEEENQE